MSDYTIIIDDGKPLLLLNTTIRPRTGPGDIVLVQGKQYQVIEHDAFNELLRVKTIKLEEWGI